MGLITNAQGLAISKGLYLDFISPENSTTFTPTCDFATLVSGQSIGVLNLPGFGFITPGSNDTFTLGTSALSISLVNSLTLSFHGLETASIFMKDLVNGTDSLDILMVGDSNIGYSVSGIYGYGNGFTSILTNLNVPIYATNLVAGLSKTQVVGTSPSNAYMQIAGITNNPGRTDEQDASSGVTWLTPGSETIYNNITAIWNSGASNELSHSGGSTRLDWAFVEPGATFTGNFYINIAPTSPFGVNNQTIIFRIGYATFTGSGGTFKPRVYSSPSNIAIASDTVSTLRAVSDTEEYKVHELTAILPENNTENIRLSKYGGGAAVSPCGFLFESAVRPNTKGFSVSAYLHRSGGVTNGAIKTALDETKNSTLRVFLKELRERQQKCGGSGRVLIFTNSGVNGNELSGDWLTGVQSIVSSVQAAWLANGFPLADLAFLITTTAPPDAAYISTTYTQWSTQNSTGRTASGNFTFTFVDMSTVTSSVELTAGGYHAGAGNTMHLSNLGYNFVSNKIIQQLLNTEFVEAYKQGGDIQQNGYLSSFEENYHKTGLKLLKKLK